MVTLRSVVALGVVVLVAVPVAAHGDCASGPGSIPGDIIYEGTEGAARFGTSVAGAGDLNGDGAGDLLVGSPDSSARAPKAGMVFILFGKAGIHGTAQVPPGFGAYTQIETTESGALLGASCAGVGDFDGDGLLDVAVGLPGAGGYPDGDDDDGVTFTGAVHIIYGSGSWPEVIDIGTLPGSRIVGAAPAENAGFSVAGAGDVNGDGLSDLLVGAPRAAPGGTLQAGRAYLVYGRADRPPVLDLQSDASVVIEGAEPYGRLGWSVAGVGDINGDGFADIAVGAPFQDPAGFVNAGRVIVLFGSPSLPDVINANGPLQGAGFRLSGGSAEERLGWTASGGDVTGDGRPDLIAGAPYAQSVLEYSHGAERGLVYVVFGQDNFPEEIPFFDMASFGTVIEGEHDWWRTGEAVAAVGDFNADGMNDFAVGAPRATPASFPQSGALYILFGRTDWPPTVSLHQWLDYGLRIAAGRSRARFASTVAAIGDHTRSEASDVAAGSPLQSRLGGECSGQVSVFTGERIPHPVNLQCLPSEDTVELTWSNPYAYDQVEVLRDGGIIAQLQGDVSSWTDTGVPVGPHTYEVRGVKDNITTSSVSCEIRIQVPPPADLSCSAVGHTVSLSWSLTGSVQSVVVSRDGEVVADLPGTATSWEDHDVPFGPHTYEVWTVVGAYESVSASCSVIVVRPPADLTCEVNGSTVTVRWSEPDPYDRVEIRRDDTLLAVFPGGLGVFTETAVPPGEHTYTLRGLIGGDASESVSCTVFIVAPPEDLACSAEGTTATVSWTAPIEYDAVHIFVPGLGDIVVPAGSTEYHLEGLAAGRYRLEVAGEKNGNLSDPVFCSVQILVAPSELSCSAEGTTVILLWANGEPYDTVVILRDGEELARLPGGTTTYRDEGVAPRTHTYEVFGATDGSVSSPVSCDVVVLTPPANFSCSAAADTVTLSWENTAAYQSLVLKRDGNVLAELPGSGTQYVDSPVAVGSHLYELQGRSGSSISETVACEVVAPGAPFDLGCSAEGTSVTLVWQNGDAYSAIQVLRDGAVIATLPGDATQYVDDTVTPGETYGYEVIGRINGNLSAPASCGISLPHPPEELLCEAQGARVHITWTIAEDPELLRVYRDSELVAELPGSARSFEESVPVPGSYEYVVQAVTGEAVSDPALCTVATVAPPADLSCVSTAGTVSLTWSAPQAYDEISVARNGEVIATLPGDATTYEDAGLSPGDYTYELVARSAQSVSDPAACSVRAPEAPADLSCIADETGVTLSWSLPEAYSGIVVLRDDQELVRLPGTATTHRDTDVQPGESYTYVVVAFVDVHQAPPVSCSITIPRPPSALTCTAEGTAVHLSWQNGDTYDAVQIVRNGTVIADSLPGDTTQYDDTGLEPGAYNYEVRGRIGNSLSSAALCAVTVIPAPGELACSIVPEANEIRLTWTNPMVYDSITIIRNGQVLTEGLDGTTTSYTDDIPTPAVWTYEIIGFALGSTSSPAVCEVQVLPPPSMLSCEAQDDAVHLSWTNSWQYAQIHVLRDGSEIAVVDGTQQQYEDQGVSPGIHQYVIYAEGEAGAATPPVPCEVEVVSPPGDFVCAVQIIGLEGRVSLQWSLTGTYDSLVVQRQGPQGTEYLGPLPGSATSFIDERVPPGSYTYRVIASIGPNTAASDPCDAEIIPPRFVRGDVNHDGRVDVADAVWLISYLFRAGPEPPCMDAGDVNDDGRLDVSDAVYLIEWRFRDGPPPPPPFPEPGVDETVDPQDPEGDLGCTASL